MPGGDNCVCDILDERSAIRYQRYELVRIQFNDFWACARAAPDSAVSAVSIIRAPAPRHLAYAGASAPPSSPLHGVPHRVKFRVDVRVVACDRLVAQGTGNQEGSCSGLTKLLPSVRRKSCCRSFSIFAAAHSLAHAFFGSLR